MLYVRARRILIISNFCTYNYICPGHLADPRGIIAYIKYSSSSCARTAGTLRVVKPHLNRFFFICSSCFLFLPLQRESCGCQNKHLPGIHAYPRRVSWYVCLMPQHRKRVNGKLQICRALHECENILKRRTRTKEKKNQKKNLHSLF